MNKIRDKIYDYELTPPAGAWEKIADDLDESLLDHSFPAQLHKAALSAPANAWEKIAAALPGTDTGSTYAAKLYSMEIDPPAGAWADIQNAIGIAEETKTPVRSIRPIWKYAAAAMLIGAVAFGISRITIQNDQAETADLVTTTKSAMTTPAEKNPVADEPVTIQDDVAGSPAPPPKRLIAAADNHRQVKKTFAVSRSIKEENTDPVLSQSIYAYADHVPDVADRYVMLMTPDGNIIRMSKKWTQLLCCVSGEDQDAGCKNQLKKWQEKMAASSLAPSPANFMDILGLVSSLDESNEL
jgi:hypothetical protein